MTILDWLVVIGSGSTILFFILAVISLIESIRKKRKLKVLEHQRPLDKRKGKKWRRRKKLLFDEKSRVKKRALILFVFTAIFLGGTGYAKFYQMTNMNEVDTENIVSSYYLVEQMSQQIALISDGSNSEKKMAENIHVLAVRMAGFSSKKGNDHGTKESQLYLNRYYAKVGQLGVNIAAQDFASLKDSKELQDSYLKDLKKVKESQKVVLEYYKIEEDSLKAKK